MDKPKLIDADKIKAFLLEVSDEWIPGSLSSIIYEKLTNGEFDPDPIPPTIKPGDKVRRKSTKLVLGLVTDVVNNKALIFSGPIIPNLCIELDCLEVSHD